MWDKSRLKLIGFALFIFFSSAAYTIIYLSSLALFLAKFGAATMPVALTIAGIILAIILYALHLFSQKYPKNSTLYIIFIVWIMTLIIAGLIILMGAIATRFFFVFSFVNFVAMRILAWNLLGVLYTPFVARKNIPFFSAILELGVVFASTLYSFCNHFHITSPLFYLSWFIGLLLCSLGALIPLRLICIKQEKTSSFKEEIPKVFSTGKRYWKRILFLLVSIFCLMIFVRVFFYYIFNESLKTTFVAEEKIGTILGIFNALSSVSIIISNMVIIPWLGKRFSSFTLLNFFSFDMILFTGAMLVFPIWGIICGVEFIRKLMVSAVFYPHFNYLCTTFGKIKRYTILTLTEGYSRQGAFILANILLLHPEGIDKRFIIGGTYVFSIITCISLIFLKKIFFQFHLEHMKTQDHEERVRSIQALGERGNFQASPELLHLLKQCNLEKSLRKYVIISLGNIQGEYYLEDLFHQMEHKDQQTQLATLNSLARYSNYKVQSFFFGLLFSQKLKSYEAKISLVRLIGKMFGKRIIPILMLGLKDSDIRIVANTIEAIGELEDPQAKRLLLPYLFHEHNRIRAQAVIALYRFRDLRDQCKDLLRHMLASDQTLQVSSALYAIRRLGLKKWIGEVEIFRNSSDKDIQRHAIFCLVQLRKLDVLGQLVELFLDDIQGPKCMHPFVTLPASLRAGIIEQIELRSKEEIEKIILLFEQSHFDVHEEIEDLRAKVR